MRHKHSASMIEALLDEEQKYKEREYRLALIEFILSHYKEGQEREHAIPTVKLFYYYLDRYPEYESKLASNAPINMSKHPAHDYASSMSGIFVHFILSCERRFAAQQEKEQGNEK